jgi:hypothetical protein
MQGGRVRVHCSIAQQFKVNLVFDVNLVNHLSSEAGVRTQRLMLPAVFHYAVEGEGWKFRPLSLIDSRALFIDGVFSFGDCAVVHQSASLLNLVGVCAVAVLRFN